MMSNNTSYCDQEVWGKFVDELVRDGAPKKEANECITNMKEKLSIVHKYRFTSYIGSVSSIALILLKAFGVIFMSWWAVFTPVLVFTVLPIFYVTYVVYSELKKLEDKVNKYESEVK